MTSILTTEKIRKLSQSICHICENILFTTGPFLKEGIYQDILIHELNLKNIQTTRELVFNYKVKDSMGEEIIIGNNQSLRTDIELPKLGGILELKSSGANTKDENISQLRNYLENRNDRYWGLVINFISKVGVRTSSKVQCSLLVKANYVNPDITPLEVTTSIGDIININKYYTENFYSLEYPNNSEILLTFEVEDEI